MSDIIYKPHKFQQKFHKSTARIRAGFGGKRSGKSEAGALEAIMCMEEKRGYKHSEIDPYLGIVIAPTAHMLRRLSLQKIKAYAGNMIVDSRESYGEYTWHNGAKMLAISADNPQRLEGVKANFVYIDEVLQVSEFLFLEAIARVSDTQGFIFCVGSLGVNFTNPKNHWAYRLLKEKPIAGSECFEWGTISNPFFPQDELERLKDTLDPRTFRQMFEIDWSVPGTALVYDEFDDANLVKGYVYNKALPTYVAIDWGFAHAMAALFIQYDSMRDKIYVFDEIVKSKLTLDQLYGQIMSRPYALNGWICDIAGNQEREQSGISNVEWFKNKGIKFQFRTAAIQATVSLVRSYIRNTKGIARLFVDEVKCPKLVDNIRNYSYPQKDGIITNENPVKKDDDAVDALRYYIMNRHDATLRPNAVQTIKR